MTEGSNKILLIGLPESGKTTFLAAFCYYVDSPASKKITQYQQSSNTTYIDSIVQDWLKGNKQERTKLAASKNARTTAEIYLEHLETKKKFTLHIPDFHGESFERQFINRSIELKYVKHIEDAGACILFIHPEKIRRPVLIEDMRVAHIIEDLINTEFETEGEEGEFNAENIESQDDPDDNQAEPFDVEKSPTQIQLMDLLEVHLEHSRFLPMKLSVVISAWDTVLRDTDNLIPIKWIENEMPLLHQFLISNSGKLLFKIFGVSAEGGDIEDPKELKRLKKMSEPANRIIVIENDIISKNILAPIEWIVKEWQETPEK